MFFSINFIGTWYTIKNFRKRPENLKTEATKQKIQETFFSLSQTMPMKKITVSKLCQACQISRSTFYLHYDNVDDLTDYLEKELLYRIEKLLYWLTSIWISIFNQQTGQRWIYCKTIKYHRKLPNESFTIIRLSYRNL